MRGHICEIVCIARVEHETVVEMKSRNIRADCDLGNIHTGIHQRSDLRTVRRVDKGFGNENQPTEIRRCNQIVNVVFGGELFVIIFGVVNIGNRNDVGILRPRRRNDSLQQLTLFCICGAC